MTIIRLLVKALHRSSSDDLDIIAHQSGVKRNLVARAQGGAPVNASDTFRLCFALEVDPMLAAIPGGPVLGDLHWPSLSIALRLSLAERDLTLREVSRRSGISLAALSRVRRGELVSADHVIAICRFMRRHPFDFVSPAIEPASPQALETRSAA